MAVAVRSICVYLLAPFSFRSLLLLYMCINGLEVLRELRIASHEMGLRLQRQRLL